MREGAERERERERERNRLRDRVSNCTILTKCTIVKLLTCAFSSMLYCDTCSLMMLTSAVTSPWRNVLAS